MPRTKPTINCQHCGKEFAQARKDQKYCSAQCRFDHFFESRENDKTQLEEKNDALRKENAALKERIAELEAQLAAPPATKKSRSKVAAS